jgi:hypothetical protein
VLFHGLCCMKLGHRDRLAGFSCSRYWWNDRTAPKVSANPSDVQYFFRMTERPHWARATTCRSMLEAELSVQTLEAEGIPARIRAHDLVGVFGPGFQGTVPRGVDLLVPSPLVDAAREALGLDEAPPPVDPAA